VWQRERVHDLPARIEVFSVAAWTGRTHALGGRVVRHDGLVTFLTGLPAPPLNPTLVEREPRDPDAALASAEARYGSAGIAFGIEVDPVRRARVRVACGRAGLILLESRPVMAAGAAAIPSPEPPEGLTILRGEPFLDDVARVDTAAFGGELDVNRAFVGSAEHDPDARAYVAFLDGVAVGCAETYLAGGVLGVFGVATIPEARRGGVGTAVTAFAIHDRRDEAEVVILDSSELGHGVYERLGFREVGVGEIWSRSET
jgi:hypothetical protein